MHEFEEISTSELLDVAAAAARSDESTESDGRWSLVRALYRRCEPEVFQAGVRWCASPEPLLRMLGADLLAGLGCRENRPFAAESVAPIEALLTDDDPRVLVSALFAFGHLGRGSAERIAMLADHSSRDVRYAVVNSLLSRDEDVARRTLIRLSVDEDVDIRDWATFGLGSQSDVDTPEIRDALVARLTEANDDVRCEAIVGLAARRDERVFPFLQAELEREWVYDLALEAATSFPRREFLPLLEAIARRNPEDSMVRDALEACRATSDSIDSERAS